MPADRLYTIVSQVLGVEAENICEEDSPDTIESWDSVAQVQLITALEVEFETSLSPDDASEMITIADIRNILRDREVDFK